MAAWRLIVDAVHRRGGVFFLQLWHTGWISHPDLQGGELPVSASAIKPKGQAFTKDGMKDHVTPRALGTDEIPPIVEDYRRAGAPLAEAPKQYWYGGGSVGYSDWPGMNGQVKVER